MRVAIYTRPFLQRPGYEARTRVVAELNRDTYCAITRAFKVLIVGHQTYEFPVSFVLNSMLRNIEICGVKTYTFR